MFNCLTQDNDSYGVNEDALGTTLHRLVESEREMGKCPHSVEAFGQFLSLLRGDRQTLVLKTPSNLRHAALISRLFPSTIFIKMVREPHAAITSGIARHDSNASIEENARRWLRDCDEIGNSSENSLVVAFEDLVQDPERVMKRISESVKPLSDAVFTYAKRMHHPERADSGRWKSKLDSAKQQQVEHWVAELKLKDAYESVLSNSIDGKMELPRRTVSAASTSPVAGLKRHFYRFWYKVVS
ncbi:tyrosylprotein sulfotransferase 2 [Rhodopirellula maiorica SM1]|uniref:Tyrosylprotein sulfotransferase 2 n=2 Tax=Novipirellula TaxID=2795426 RepID=M5R8F1_9BACT|nr:tyrosylprotein sulfotransferase 2 [Rhodopirellula maiorica SM1]